MDKIKKYWPVLLGALLVIAAVSWFLASQKPKMILFYSDSCPHCQNVENYISSNNIRNKYKFQELEVSKNQDNAALLGAKAGQCGLDVNNGVGVPLFYDGQSCLVGDQDIINYFKK